MQSEEWCQVRGVAITPDQGANDRWAVGCILEANHEGSHDAFNGALSVVTVVWEGV